jgi:hypothetical protein
MMEVVEIEGKCNKKSGNIAKISEKCMPCPLYN